MCFPITDHLPTIDDRIAISFREGNFATGSLIPENPSLEHWKLASGLLSNESRWHQCTPPPFPVLTVAMELS